MKKVVCGLLTCLSLVLFITLQLVRADEAFIITFPSQSLKAGEETIATIEKLDESITIISISWVERPIGLFNRSNGTNGTPLVIDYETNTVSFCPRYNNEGWIEIHYKNSNNQTLEYISDIVRIENGVHVSCEMPELSEYIPFDQTYTVKYIISGVRGKMKVTPFWWVFTDRSQFFQYEDSIEITKDCEISVTYTPTEQARSVDFGIDIMDDTYNYVFHDNHGSTVPIAKPELWDEAIYIWSDDNSEVTATRYYNKHIDSYGNYTWDIYVTESVQTTSEIIPATERNDGIITYTAVFKKEIFDTQTKEVIIPATGKMLDVSGWIEINGNWYYGDNEKYAVTGPTIIDGIPYCFNEDGAMITGWALVEGKWYYAQPTGILCNNGWKEVNGAWYYFYSNGEMATGWLNDGGTYYYMKSDGTMATGWVEDDDRWYYMSDSGAMNTGWIQSGGTWYMLKSNGEMATGWTQSGGVWYYFTNSGIMKTGWFEDKEAEATLSEGQKRSIWYWFDSDGVMAKGWKEINGQWEMFSNSGEWQYTWDGN